jgi:hypothetical protein
MRVLESIINKYEQVAEHLKKTRPGSIDLDVSVSTTTTTTVDPQFTPEQTLEINTAMKVIFDLFGGADKFFALTGILELKFVYKTKLSCAASNAVSCYVGNGVIEMSATAFRPVPLVSGWYIAHEVGHAFDFSRCRGNPRLYRSQAFVDHFVPKSWWQRMLRLPVGKVAGNVGYQSGNWTEIAKATFASIRGQLNSAEDFAETFAVIYALTVIQGALPYRSFNSQWRFNKVKAMIQGDIVQNNCDQGGSKEDMVSGTDSLEVKRPQS